MAPAQVSPEVVRFGVFEADLRAGELRRNGAKVRIQDLPFRALTLLLTHPGVVITREEFRQSLWPADVFVDFEQGISSAIMRLRDALRDSADNPIFIETIERRGYRWISPINSFAAEPVTRDHVAHDQATHDPVARGRPWRCAHLEKNPENDMKKEVRGKTERRDFTAGYEIELTTNPGKPR